LRTGETDSTLGTRFEHMLNGEIAPHKMDISSKIAFLLQLKEKLHKKGERGVVRVQTFREKKHVFVEHCQSAAANPVADRVHTWTRDARSRSADCRDRAALSFELSGAGFTFRGARPNPRRSPHRTSRASSLSSPWPIASPSRPQ